METMTMKEAAEALGVPVGRVRRWCQLHDEDETAGLAYEWTSGAAPTTSTDGRTIRGHRRPLRSAVADLAKRIADGTAPGAKD